jgi:hypothetical protein
MESIDALLDEAVATTEKARVITAKVVERMTKEADARKRKEWNTKLNALTKKVAELKDAMDAFNG